MKTSINIWTASNVLSFQSLFSWLCKIWEGIQHEQPSVQGQAGHLLQQAPSLRRLQDDPHLRGGGVEYPRRAAFTVTSLSLRIRWHNRCKDVGSSRILRQFISLVFSLFMDFGSLCNEEKPEDKEEAAPKESKIWVQMQRLWQTTEGFKRSMQHWTQAMAVPRAFSEVNNVPLPKQRHCPQASLWAWSLTQLWDKGEPLQQQPLQAKHAEKND